MKYLPWIIAGVVATGLGVAWWMLTKRGVRAGARQTTVVLTDPSGAMRETVMATSAYGARVAPYSGPIYEPLPRGV